MLLIFFWIQTRLKEELKCKRVEALKQLAHQAEEIQGVEKEIISTGQKLGTILNENSKLKQVWKIICDKHLQIMYHKESENWFIWAW